MYQVGQFVEVLVIRAAKTLMSTCMCICAGSSEPSLLDNSMRTNVSGAGPIDSFHIVSAHAPNCLVPRYLREITLEGATFIRLPIHDGIWKR